MRRKKNDRKNLESWERCGQWIFHCKFRFVMRRNFSGPGRFIRLKSNQLSISQIDLMHFFSGGRYDNFDEPAPLDLSRGRLKVSERSSCTFKSFHAYVKWTMFFKNITPSLSRGHFCKRFVKMTSRITHWYACSRMVDHLPKLQGTYNWNIIQLKRIIVIFMIIIDVSWIRILNKFVTALFITVSMQRKILCYPVCRQACWHYKLPPHEKFCSGKKSQNL